MGQPSPSQRRSRALSVKPQPRPRGPLCRTRPARCARRVPRPFPSRPSPARRRQMHAPLTARTQRAARCSPRVLRSSPSHGHHPRSKGSRAAGPAREVFRLTRRTWLKWTCAAVRGQERPSTCAVPPPPSAPVLSSRREVPTARAKGAGATPRPWQTIPTVPMPGTLNTEQDIPVFDINLMVLEFR